MTSAERAAVVGRLTEALAVVEGLRLVLDLAVTDLRTNPDDRECANVARFATTYGVRQVAVLHGHLTGMP